MRVRFKLCGQKLKMLGRVIDIVCPRHDQRIVGDVGLDILYEDGETERRKYRNTILLHGRAALARCLANEVGDDFQFYVNRMIFGNGGTLEGTPKYVNSERNSLFGMNVVSRPVIATVNKTDPNVVTFTAVVAKTDPYVGVMNEMALQMANGDLYSMVTFPDLTKTSLMQLTWSWDISFL